MPSKLSVFVKPRVHGFTSVELVMVIVLVGILAVVALPKFLNNTSVASLAFRNDVLSAVRYAQKYAVSHRRLVCMTLSSNAVTLQMSSTNPSTTCSAALSGPDAKGYTSKSTSITAIGTAVTNQFLYFQPSGIVTTDGAGVNIASGVNASIFITGQTKPIVIEGATGHVE